MSKTSKIQIPNAVQTASIQYFFKTSGFRL